MSYSRHRGISGQRAYQPVSLADEQEELRLMRLQAEQRSAAKSPPPTAPPQAIRSDPQART